MPTIGSWFDSRADGACDFLGGGCRGKQQHYTSQIFMACSSDCRGSRPGAGEYSWAM